MKETALMMIGAGAILLGAVLMGRAIREGRWDADPVALLFFAVVMGAGGVLFALAEKMRRRRVVAATARKPMDVVLFDEASRPR